MTAARFRQIDQLFQAALGIPAADRAMFIATSVKGDDALRQAVERMLDSHTAGGRFLEPAQPPARWRSGSGWPPGTRVGPFRIIRLLGFGGMGAVYEAEQDRPQRIVALKTLQAALVIPGIARRLEQEAQILARLRHPGIAQIYEVGALDDGPAAVPWFAMEFIPDARTIVEFARQKQLFVRQRVELLARVCDAVHHGHQKGVIHRDLKPPNILIDPAGDPRVIDFGVARVMSADATFGTRHTGGQLIGTLPYMPPEQCAGDGDLDIRSDVYGLGAVLYELLAGHTPLDLAKLSIPEAIRAITEREPVPLGLIDRSLRGDLETVVGKALQKERDRRYASAAEFAADLRRVLRYEPIAARPPTLLYQLRTLARRNRGLVAGLVVAVLALAAGASLSIWQAVVATAQRDRAVDAEKAAQLEVDRAQRVADFLAGALGAASPMVPASVAQEVLTTDFEPWADWRMGGWAYAGESGRLVTLRDVLLLARGRAASDFGADPAIRARLCDTLGLALYRTVYQAPRLDMQARTEAAAALEEALTACRAAFEPDHEQTIRVLLHLGELRTNEGEHRRGELYFREAVDSARRRYGRFDARTLRAERALAWNVAFMQSCYEETREWILENLLAAEEAGVQSPALCSYRAYAAVVLSGMGRWEEALSHGRRAVAEVDGLGPADSIYAADVRQWVAMFMERRADTAAEGVPHQAHAIEIFERVFGERSYPVAAAWSLLGRLYLRLNQPQQAEEPIRRAYGVFHASLGPESWDTRSTGARLARLLTQMEREPEECEQLYRQFAEAWRWEGADRLKLDALLSAARAAESAHGPAGALRQLDEAVEMLATNQTTNLPARQRAEVWSMRGHTLLRLERRDEARECLTSLRHVVAEPAPADGDVQRMLTELETTLDGGH